MAPYAALLDDCHGVTKPTLEELRQLVEGPGGRRLVVFQYAWESLEPLACLPELEILKIQSTGALRSLAGAEALSHLRVLVISPPPSWEGSRRCIDVASYRPLQSLTRLERLTLLRVRPLDHGLSPIAAMRHLNELHIAGVPEITVSDYAKLAAAMPATQGRCLQPYTTIEGIGSCKRCGDRTVLLTGAPPRSRNWLCPRCNAKKLADHVQQWEAHKNGA